MEKKLSEEDFYSKEWTKLVKNPEMPSFGGTWVPDFDKIKGAIKALESDNAKLKKEVLDLSTSKKGHHIRMKKALDAQGPLLEEINKLKRSNDYLQQLLI